ncbi:MAG: oligosaccharide flippase family protein [Thermodesulfobacteriota bacterium]
MTSRLVFQNTLFLTGSGFLTKFLAYFYFLIMTRCFEVGQIGVYGLLVTSMMFMEILANLGLDRIIVRELARSTDNESIQTFHSAFFLKITAAAGVYVASLLVFKYVYAEIYYSNRPALIIFFLSILPLVAARSLESWFMAKEKMHLPAFSQLLERVILLAAAGLAAWGKIGFKGFLITAFIAVTARMLAISLAFPWASSRRSWPTDLHQTRFLLGEASKMLAVEMLAVIYFRVDLFLLTKMTDLKLVGLYHVSYKVFDFFITFFAGYLTAVFPTLSRQRERFALGRNLILGGAITALVALTVILLRAPLLSIFRPEYLAGRTALTLLMLTLPLSFVTSLLANFAVASERIALLVRIALVLVAGNLGLNFLLIPRLSIEGAALATLLTEILSAALMLACLWTAIVKNQNVSADFVPLGESRSHEHKS